MPEGDIKQEAKDHGNLIDLAVAEVEEDAEGSASRQNERRPESEELELTQTDAPTGAAAFSEAQLAEEVDEQRAVREASNATSAYEVSDDQSAELLAEQIAAAEHSTAPPSES